MSPSSRLRRLIPVLTAVVGILSGGTFALIGNGCQMTTPAPLTSPNASEVVVGGALDQPKTLLVGGSIRNVDRASRTVILRTAMDLDEAIRFDGRTEVSRDGHRLSWEAVTPGMPVKISYQLQGDESVLAESIVLGKSVRYCPCGPDCRCPPSRGCRVIRQSSAR